MLYLSDSQKRALQLLKDWPDARLHWMNRVSKLPYIVLDGKREYFADRTIAPLVRGGFVKNAGSLRYREYTISQTGLIGLKEAI